MATTHTRARRTVTVVLGVLLVVAGIALFSTANSVTLDVVSAVAIVAGIGVVRYGSNPKRRQVV